MSELLRATIALQDDSIRMLDDKLEAKDAEIERLNTLAADAIKYLTDEIGVGDDPVAFVCAAYVASRQEIQRLTASLEAARKALKEST